MCLMGDSNIGVCGRGGYTGMVALANGIDVVGCASVESPVISSEVTIEDLVTCSPCTVSPTHVHSLSVAHFMHSLVYCCEAPSEGYMDQPHTYGISCNRAVAHRFCHFC